MGEDNSSYFRSNNHLAFFVPFVCIDVCHLLTSDCLIGDLNFGIWLPTCNMPLDIIHK